MKFCDIFLLHLLFILVSGLPEDDVNVQEENVSTFGGGASEVPSSQILTGFQLRGSVPVPGIKNLKNSILLNLPGLLHISSVVSTVPYKESLSFWSPELRHHANPYALSKKIEGFTVNGKISDFVTFYSNATAEYLYVLTTEPVNNVPVTISIEPPSTPPTDPNQFGKLYILRLVQLSPPHGVHTFEIVKWEYGSKFGFCSCIYNSLLAPAAPARGVSEPAPLAATLPNSAFATRSLSNGVFHNDGISINLEESSGGLKGVGNIQQTIPLTNPGLVNSVQSTSGLFFLVADEKNCCGEDGVSILVLGTANIYFPAGCLPVKNVVSVATTVINDYACIVIASAPDTSATGHGNTKYGHGHGPKGSIHLYCFDKTTNTFEKLCELPIYRPLQVRFGDLATQTLIYTLSDEPVNNVRAYTLFAWSGKRWYSTVRPTCPSHTPLLIFTAEGNPTQLRPNSYIVSHSNGAHAGRSRTHYEVLMTTEQGFDVYETTFEDDSKKLNAAEGVKIDT